MDDFPTQTVIAHFDSVFRGPNGDYPAVLESLVGVTAEKAMWRPQPECNSIWQIVEHLTASILWQLEVLEHGSAAAPQWVEPRGGETEWQASLARLKDADASLRTAMAQLPREELLAIPRGEQQTQLVLLLSTAAHEAHHGGQIDYLKGLQGLR